MKIAPGFDTVVVTPESGGVQAGVVASEDATMRSLRTPENRWVELKKSAIAKREGAPSSMPEIYGSILTPVELRTSWNSWRI